MLAFSSAFSFAIPFVNNLHAVSWSIVTMATGTKEVSVNRDQRTSFLVKNQPFPASPITISWTVVFSGASTERKVQGKALTNVSNTGVRNIASVSPGC